MRRATLALLACCTAALACSDNLTPASDRQIYDGGGEPPLQCVPNLDGRIDSNELQAAIGVPATYLVSPQGEERPVDVVGEVDGAGKRVWDWSANAPTDQIAVLTASALTGKWYAASFPSGQFVTPSDAAGSLEAVYVHDEQALWLLGFASAVEAPAEGKTLVVYQQPVALYRFPVQVGGSWASAGTVQNATIRGLPYAGRDTYEVSVDAAGTLHLPDVTFSQALRTRTRITSEPAVGASVQRRQVSFLFECFGEVARAQSRDDESAGDFTTAVEVRRLGL
ncbi:MAG: hypothetical protein HY906_12350 [Deltaproteobacteria bacterium]|nr:hypothetical protein [Deltaproteobacteria bacterium]